MYYKTVQDDTVAGLPLAINIFIKLRESILRGKLKNGEKLTEQRICNEYNVSRTPVREAFRLLEQEGLITMIPNRGAFVIGVSTKDIQDIYEIRSRLEGLCARWAAAFITDEQLAELEENIYLCEFHGNKGNFEQVLELDNRFHETLYEASASKELIHVLKDYHQYVSRARRVTLADPDRVKASTEEHKLIVQALRDRDADLAEKYAHAHIQSTKANMDRVGWDNLC